MHQQVVQGVAHLLRGTEALGHGPPPLRGRCRALAADARPAGHAAEAEPGAAVLREPRGREVSTWTRSWGKKAIGYIGLLGDFAGFLAAERAEKRAANSKLLSIVCRPSGQLPLERSGARPAMA